MAGISEDAGKRAELFGSIVEHLRGTCRSVQDAAAAFEVEDDLELIPEFCEVLDNELFCCDTCSWWCEWSEESPNDEDAGNCDDCCPGNED